MPRAQGHFWVLWLVPPHHQYVTNLKKMRFGFSRSIRLEESNQKVFDVLQAVRRLKKMPRRKLELIRSQDTCWVEENKWGVMFLMSAQWDWYRYRIAKIRIHETSHCHFISQTDFSSVVKRVPYHLTHWVALCGRVLGRESLLLFAFIASWRAICIWETFGNLIYSYIACVWNV